MSKPDAKRASDSAVGPVAGYLFQFEKALLSLTELKSPSEFVSIEEVDDVATHSGDGTVISTLQAKHSISSSGSSFEDTSRALWRTMEIWINKVEDGTFNDQTKFICASNKQVPESSLLFRMIQLSFDESIKEIDKLRKAQQVKLKDAIKDDPNSGASIRETIRLIKLVLKKKETFKTIRNNLSISSEDNILEVFLNNLHIGTDDMTLVQKQNIYHAFYGWIVYASKAKWLNDKEARFTKKSFDTQWFHIRSNSSIINAIFRTKESLGTIHEHDILKKQTELFVRQIDDIERNKAAKSRIIREAIKDFIMAEVELEYVVEKGNYTRKDFDDFLDECCEAWRGLIDRKTLKELHEYSDEEKNHLAIEIYDGIMSEIQIEFKDGFRFTTKNAYVRNGCFLNLSNVPRLGWHPEWEKKYKL